MSGVLGAVLAGGLSRRFDGDKALALLDGRRLVDHAIGALTAACDAVVICGRALPGLPAVGDRPAPGLGPLGGLAGALHAARQAGHAHVLSVPCDVPYLPDDLYLRLREAGGAQAAFLSACPVVGLWPATLGDPLDEHLRHGGDRSMRGWIARIGAIGLDGGGTLANINTRDDLRRIAHDPGEVPP